MNQQLEEWRASLLGKLDIIQGKRVSCLTPLGGFSSNVRDLRFQVNTCNSMDEMVILYGAISNILD